MSLYRRKDSPNWWVKLSVPGGGAPIQRSTGIADRKKAQQLHDRLKAELWDQLNLGIKPRYTWNEAVVRYVSECQGKKSLEKDKMHLRWIDPHWNGTALADINRTRVDALADARAAAGASNATVNRTLALIKALLRKAANEWEWIDRVPYIRLRKESSRRIRFLTQSDAGRLLNELPPHLAQMVKFSLLTGLRQSNVLFLRWDQIDLQAMNPRAWIHGDQSKGGKALPVPLVPEAVQVLNAELGQHSEFVFTYRGNPIRSANTKAFRAALSRAGISDFRWHDLRHTWASWHIQAGTPLGVLQELGGWESVSMVRRYAHLAADHLHDFAKNVAVGFSSTTQEQQSC